MMLKINVEIKDCNCIILPKQVDEGMKEIVKKIIVFFDEFRNIILI